jgi:hypothetical protein
VGPGDGGARRSCLDDPVVELGKFALGEFPPGADVIGTKGDERLEFAQREASVSQEQNLSDQSHGRNGYRRWPEARAGVGSRPSSSQ